MQEFAFIDWIRSRQSATARVLLPAGDDLAVVKWDAGDLLLVGVDQVLDGVHFDSKRHAPALIGRKAMNRNLSDCSAMACLPAGAVVSLAIPRGTDKTFLMDLYLGIEKAGAKFDCPIVGGDTGSWTGPLAVTVAIYGRSAGVEPITRTGARAGDRLFISGPLGGSILGRHLTFEPRVELSRRLAATRQITAMIDVSDGLSRDIRHLLENQRPSPLQSTVGSGDQRGALLRATAIPVHADVAKLPADSMTALEHALHDGEDHELLFTAADGFDATAFPVVEVGRITAEPGVWIETSAGRRPLERRGWEHAI